jgi:LEA14-like dessication related protein
MKKQWLWVLGAGAGLFLVGKFLFRKKEAIKNLNVNVTKIDWNKQNKNIVVDVRLINPSNAPIVIKSIVADVIWKGTTGATIDYRQPFTLNSLESKTISLPVKLNLELVTIITDLLGGKLKDIINGKFELKGSVNAEGLVVPFTYSKDISLTA